MHWLPSSEFERCIRRFSLDLQQRIMIVVHRHYHHHRLLTINLVTMVIIVTTFNYVTEGLLSPVHKVRHARWVAAEEQVLSRKRRKKRRRMAGGRGVTVCDRGRGIKSMLRHTYTKFYHTYET